MGLDIAAAEIAINDSLGETIVGDIQTYPLAPASFDAAVCLNVLEHLGRPVAALDNMRRALRPGGLLLLSVPNLRSLKTCGVRATPVWLHRRLWRHLYPRAAPDHGPFPAVHHAAIDLDELARYAQHHGMALTSITYESEMQARIRAKLRLTGRRWIAVASGVHVATLGHLDAWHSDAMLILQRPYY